MRRSLLVVICIVAIAVPLMASLGGFLPGTPTATDAPSSSATGVTPSPSQLGTTTTASAPFATPTGPGRSLSPTVSPDPAVEPAHWELAPDARPTADSTSLDVVVYGQSCASGRSPEGRIVGPTIDYRPDEISVWFGVKSVNGDCQGSPGAPARVRLTEPIGSRRVVDGGVAPPISRLEFDGTIRILTGEEPDALVHNRWLAAIGGEGCRGFSTLVRRPDEETSLEELAQQLPGSEGMLPFATGWVGQFGDAVRAFGGTEALRGPSNAVAQFIGVADGGLWLSPETPLGAIVLGTLVPVSISGDRTVWLPDYYSYGVSRPRCDDTLFDPSASAGPESRYRVEDFVVGLSAPRSDYPVGDAIGLEVALLYDGPLATSTVAGRPVFGYGFEQLDGDIDIEPIDAGRCEVLPVTRGEPVYVPLEKSLPAGIWRVSVVVDFTAAAGCTADTRVLRTSVVITVR